MTEREEAHWVATLLIITVSMGMLDAISLLHLGTFTGYMSGTVILVGVGFAQASKVTLASVVALCAFMLGALGGGRLVRRPYPSPRLVSDILIGVGLLVIVASLLSMREGVLSVTAILGLAMGLQTSATRHAGIADMSMPAATMVLHGLFHDSYLAGGRGERTRRRLGALLGLIAGAMLGALISRWSVPAAMSAVALLIAMAAFVLRRLQPA